MSWTTENRAQLLASLRRVISLSLSDCENIGEVPHSPMSIYNNPTYNNARFTFNNGARIGEAKKPKQTEKGGEREKKPRKERTPEQQVAKARRKEERKKAKEDKKAKKQQAKVEKKATREARREKTQQDQQMLQEQMYQQVLHKQSEQERGVVAMSEYSEMIANMGGLTMEGPPSSSASSSLPGPSSSSSSMPLSALPPTPSSSTSSPALQGKKDKQPQATCSICKHKFNGLYPQPTSPFPFSSHLPSPSPLLLPLLPSPPLSSSLTTINLRRTRHQQRPPDSCHQRCRRQR